MLGIWHTIKGYAAGAAAFIACPCHLPLTLPLLVALTAGTAFSRWLAGNTVLVGAISTVLFVAGLALALKWMGQTQTATARTGLSKDASSTSAACPSCEEVPRTAKEHALRPSVPKP